MCVRAFLRLGLAISVVALMLSGGLAQNTMTWLGNTTSWDAAQNWQPGIGGTGWVPTSVDNVIIPSGLTNYPNLTYVNLGPKTCNNIRIQPGAQLKFTTGGNAVLEVNSSWRDEGTLVPGTGTVRLVSTAQCTVSTETFYLLQNNKYIVTPFGVTAGNAYLAGNVSVTNNLTFQYGILHCGTFDLIGVGPSNSLLLNNGFLNWGRETLTTSFETVDFDSGTVEFDRVGNQTVPSIYAYCNLAFSGGGTKTLDGDIAPTGLVRVWPGATLDITGRRVDIGGSLALVGTSVPEAFGGILIMGDESILTLDGDGISVADRAIFSAIGTGARNMPIVTRPVSSSQYYSFHFIGVRPTMSASYAIFEYMDYLGVDLDADALVDPAHPMDHCTFQNGDTSPGFAALIHIDNSQDLYIDGANFPVMGLTNVEKDLDAGSVTFYGATGAFAGQAFEVDPYNRINWLAPPEPAPPQVVIERSGVSARLIWNTVNQNNYGDPIVVDTYQVYSDSNPTGPFSTLEATVAAPDTSWTDVGILSGNLAKYYKVTATMP